MKTTRAGPAVASVTRRRKTRDMDLSGAVHFYYLFDVADTIDLAGLTTVAGEGVTAAPLPLRPHTSPAYLQFPAPPLIARLPDRLLRGHTVTPRVKLFDYGVISVRLTVAYSGNLDGIQALLTELRGAEETAQMARDVAERVQADIPRALDEPHAALVEDYNIVEIERTDPTLSGSDFVERHAMQLAQLLLGETGPLAPSEVEEALRVRFAYYADDLTIVQWDIALVYDRRDSAEAIEDILEFANSQLVELRTYDALLDRELDVIYAAKPTRGFLQTLLGRRAADQAANLRYLIVDVLELLDRSSNALKMIGDAYYARIYRGAAARLGLADWQQQVNEKLASVGDMYRFFNDQARAARDEFLELIVILLFLVEIVIGFVQLKH
ncbi:MAG: hypothetical protein JOZ38_00430 [Candidatus Eremiobacteraeota bacterium]|nr:hypothetical protein [Candidatus Eremiobacteraeota bacterium]